MGGDRKTVWRLLQISWTDLLYIRFNSVDGKSTGVSTIKEVIRRHCEHQDIDLQGKLKEYEEMQERDKLERSKEQELRGKLGSDRREDLVAKFRESIHIYSILSLSLYILYTGCGFVITVGCGRQDGRGAGESHPAEGRE